MDGFPLITVVTVAFNNPQELDCFFDSLHKQIAIISRIVCVDNSSDDYLESNHMVVKKWSNCLNIHYCINDTGIKGSARGFKIGVTEALKHKFDFVWINDQDGVPKEDCLMKLIDAYNKTGQSGIYAPIVLAKDGQYVLNNFRCNVNIFKRRKLSNYKVSNRVSVISFAATTGILVHKDIINACGVYNDEAFFVGLEDAEYSYRVIKNRFKIFLVQNALYFHPDLYVKYRKRPSSVLLLLRKFPLYPNYMGSVKKNDATMREIYFCIGNSYINSVYCSFFPRLINTTYSVLRMFISKFFHKDICIHETLKLYKKGKTMARHESTVQRKKHENKESSQE